MAVSNTRSKIENTKDIDIFKGYTVAGQTFYNSFSSFLFNYEHF